MFIPVVLKAPRYFIYICTEETRRPLSATSTPLADILELLALHVST